jgi:hypothetical protein
MKIAEQLGYTEPQRMLNSYMNAGFVGVKREDIEFLQIWQRLIDKAADCFGLDKKKFNQSSDEFNILKAADQDLFNLTAMISKVELSEMGPEAMDFIGGGWLMSHATGSAKPWNKSFFYSFLKGRPPGGPDKLFWKFSQYPIPVFTTGHYLLKTWSIKLFSFLGRFYRRH